MAVDPCPVSFSVAALDVMTCFTTPLAALILNDAGDLRFKNMARVQLFDLGTTTEQQQISNFLALNTNGGDIPGVPDGSSTLALMGLAFAVLGLVHSRKCFA